MEYNEIILYIVIGITSIISVWGFNNREVVEKLMYNEFNIEKYKEYYRFLSSALVHADGMHLFFNMFVLYSFGGALLQFSVNFFISTYLFSILSGSFVSYLLHRHDYNYRALGASGGVTGVLMAFVILVPDAPISIFFIPYGIPAYIFASLYLVYSIYSMQNKIDNIGHDAHLGGALVGVIMPFLFYPDQVNIQNWKIAIVILPLIYFIIYVIKNRRN